MSGLAFIIAGGVAATVALFAKKANALNPPNNGTVQPDRGITIGGQPVGGGGGRINPVGLTGTVGQTGLQTAGIFATPGSSFATAIPVVGAALSVGLGIWGAIRAHHQQAVALEAQTLNKAVPHFQQGLIKVAEGLMTRQMTPTEAKVVLDLFIADYDKMVAPIVRGIWNWQDGPPSRYASDYDFNKKPDPCNGPCVVRHYWIVGDAGVINAYANDIYNGAHGQIKLGPIPAHAGFTGTGEIVIRY